MDIDMQQLSDNVINLVTTHGLKILIAIVIFLVGLWVIGLITKFTRKHMVKTNVDPSLAGFLVSVANVSLKILLIITVVSQMGVETTSFVAVVGAATFAVGLALQGSLANFAGGVLILLFKPFKTGDFVSGAGETGTVEKVDVFHTTLLSPDNKVIIIPNGPMANSNIINYTTKPIRRVDMSVGISYGADIKQARQVILDVFSKDARIAKDPAPVVFLTELGDSSLNLSCRVYSANSDYWGVMFDNLEAIKEALDAAGISIPFPQMDVHLSKE